MKPYSSTRKRGVAILAGGLAFVGSAEATELITDGSFENTKASSNPVVKVGGQANPGVGGGWSTFSTYLYSTLYTMPGPSGSGLGFLRPYPSGQYGITQSSTVVTQLVSLTASTSLTPAKIDAGAGRYRISAWFSSYLTQGDFSDLTLKFLDANNSVIGEPIALGGTDFVSNIPTESNSKFPNAKDWAQDVRADTIPAGARLALVTVAAGSPASGAPDGYVDLVSLDVADAALSTPTVAAANPSDNAVGVGPVVNVELTLQDRSTAVNTNSIRLLLDDAPLAASSIQKTETNTIVKSSVGLLPPLSAHTYKIIFSDLGSSVTTQTNQFRFTVADYITLPASLQTALGSEEKSKPGFNVSVYQVETISGEGIPAGTQVNLPASISFSEAVLAGLVGTNIADLSGAESGNTIAVPGVIDWINTTGVSANFPGDAPFPGAIAGTSGVEESFVDDIRTFVRFPTAGFYQMGINNEDQFRLTAGTNGYQTLQITGATNFFVPSVAIATNITQLQFGGALPKTPLTAQIAYATPSGNPDEACTLGVNANPALVGKIGLLDRGGTNCNSAAKAEQAQTAGAVAVIEITPGDQGFPFRIDDINTNVHIPVLVIAENYGGSRLKALLTNGSPVSATIKGDPNLVVAEWDGPKGFGAVDVTFGFAVPAAGLYPLRLVAGQEAGRANLEWFTINPDGTRVLLNDTNTPGALLAFRARTGGSSAAASFNAPTLSAGKINISWTGSGTLEEAPTVTGPWTPSSSQANPQAVATTGNAKFYRIRQP